MNEKWILSTEDCDISSFWFARLTQVGVAGLASQRVLSILWKSVVYKFNVNHAGSQASFERCS